MLKYVNGNSSIHLLDARVKLLWLVFFIALAVSSKLLVAASLSLFVLACYAMARISVLKIVRENWVLVLFALFPFILRALFEQGQITEFGYALPLGPVNGVLNALYLFAVFFASLLYIYTTKLADIRSALSFFLMPPQLCIMFSVALQALPLLQRKMQAVQIAQASRGGGGPVPAMMPVMHSVFRRANTMAISMESRGFDPENPHVASRLRMKNPDWLSLGFMIFCFALFAALKLGFVTLQSF